MFGHKQRASTLGRLESELKTIFGRLELLETAPAPDPPPTATDPATTEHLQALQAGADSARLDLTDIDRKLKELTFAVEEGIERVARSERRIQATIARARKELKDRDLEDPGVEAEAAQLRVVDGGGSEDGGVPAVPAKVAEPADAPSSVRGVSAAALRQVRGF